MRESGSTVWLPFYRAPGDGRCYRGDTVLHHNCRMPCHRPCTSLYRIALAGPGGVR